MIGFGADCSYRGAGGDVKFGTDARQSVRELARKTRRFGRERAPLRFAAMVEAIAATRGRAGDRSVPAE
ncbi:MAG: hypothetical protein P8049_08545 [Gemmatimonadota bacterium]